MLGGDLLFAGSIGRTDLPFSNPDAMETSLGLVATFDPGITVYPGHGPPTSIGAELATNPYLQGHPTSQQAP
jgi:glyoxylase-like metal-dependent hydrolase (beta-lactamase superfamily II)